MYLRSCFPKEFYLRQSAHFGVKPFVSTAFGLAQIAVLLCGFAAWPGAGLAQETRNAGSKVANLPDAPRSMLQMEAVASLAGDSSSSVIEMDAGGQQQVDNQDPPAAAVTPSRPADQPAQQTKRILGIIPNFRSVSTDVKLPPETAKEKFLTATSDSFDYSSIFIPAMLAVYSMETDATPEFGHGAVGYGRYFWHSAVDQTSENYLVEFVGPVITHEDARYYTLGRGGFAKRTGYALSRAFITRTDSQRETFNFSEVVGAGASAGISSFYYPSRERSFANVGTAWGLDIGIDAASFVAKEFWPDINHRLFHGNGTVSGMQR
jgi:hypothetical protein